MALQARVRRTRKGDFQLRLPRGEREALRSLPAQLRDLLATDDPALERLFPPAYGEDRSRSAEYSALVRDDLSPAGSDRSRSWRRRSTPTA